VANCGLRRDIARQASKQHARGGVCRKAAVSNRAHARLHRRTEISLLLHRHNDAMAHLGGVVLPDSYAIYSLVHLPHFLLLFHATANISTSNRSLRSIGEAWPQTCQQTSTAALRQPHEPGMLSTPPLADIEDSLAARSWQVGRHAPGQTVRYGQVHPRGQRGETHSSQTHQYPPINSDCEIPFTLPTSRQTTTPMPPPSHEWTLFQATISLFAEPREASSSTHRIPPRTRTGSQACQHLRYTRE
jgi:hypothetical protein